MEILILGIVMAWLVGRKLDKFSSLGAAALIILPVVIVNFGLRLFMNARYSSVWLNIIDWHNLAPMLIQLLIMWLLCFWAKSLRNRQAIFVILVLGSFLVLFFVPQGFNVALTHIRL